jgi:hypothetical protein
MVLSPALGRAATMRRRARRSAPLFILALGLMTAAALRPAFEAKVDPVPAIKPDKPESPREFTVTPPTLASAEPARELAAAALVRLRASALGGNVGAAWSAFQIAEFCETPGRNRSALRDMPVGMFTMLRATLEPEAEANTEICTGVTAAQLSERRAYLSIAADGGVPGAAVKFFDLGPSDSPSDDNPADTEIKSWGEHALALLQRDAARGDLGALTTLETVYQYGGIAPANATQALTYQLAVQELMTAGAQKFAPAELDLQREAAARLGSQLPPEQRRTATAAAADLVAHAGLPSE